MRSIPRRVAHYLSVIGIVLGLAACGSAGPANSPASSNQRPAASTAASNAAPRASIAASASAGASAAASPATAASAYADIPQSTTAEGYQVLGDPAAPVVLTHYSDFL